MKFLKKIPHRKKNSLPDLEYQRCRYDGLFKRELYNTSSLLIRRLELGDGSIAYYNAFRSDGSILAKIYEGEISSKKLITGGKARIYLKRWLVQLMKMQRTFLIQ